MYQSARYCDYQDCVLIRF